MRCVQAVVVLVALFVLVDFSYGEFEERNSIFGPSTVTYDSNTGLEWLDVTASTNMSVNGIETELGEDGVFHGWRYASPDELEVLFFYSAGLPPTEQAILEDAPLYLEMLRLFGITMDSVVPGCYSCFRAVTGFHAGAPSPSSRNTAIVSVSWDGDLIDDVYANAVGGMGYVSVATEFIGHWLVRDASSVPVAPMTWSTVKALYRSREP